MAKIDLGYAIDRGWILSAGVWREMIAADLPGVVAIAGLVHPGFPEDAAVFAERLALYPAGCFVLGSANAVDGYVVAHPWWFGRPPKLNSLLGQLPEGADTLYLHDIAIRPGLRGGGAGRRVVEKLVGQARGAGFGSVSLVAVRETPRFWRGLGFEAVKAPGIEAVLASYAGAVFMARRVGCVCRVAGKAAG